MQRPSHDSSPGGCDILAPLLASRHYCVTLAGLGNLAFGSWEDFGAGEGLWTFQRVRCGKSDMYLGYRCTA